ncbi:MAG: twin-arginine translocase TatA/TatE family subunit [Rikenellaceae bacterium]
MNSLFIGGLGTGELLVVAAVLLIFFGGAKLPELMRGAGRGIKEFKDALNEPVENNTKQEVEAQSNAEK